jgi:hypothetical protein
LLRICCAKSYERPPLTRPSPRRPGKTGRPGGLWRPALARPRKRQLARHKDAAPKNPSYQGESRLPDSPEGVCAGQARFEYPATSVPFSSRTGPGRSTLVAWIGHPRTACDLVLRRHRARSRTRHRRGRRQPGHRTGRQGFLGPLPLGRPTPAPATPWPPSPTTAATPPPGQPRCTVRPAAATSATPRPSGS